jgi:alkyldihydroxyacetonephosphate synthase
LLVERESLLAHVDGDVPVMELEHHLGGQGLTLAVSPLPSPHVTIGDWLAAGAPGARSFWVDPADHLVAGFQAETAKGVQLAVRPAPRRSVGPDFFALGFGTQGSMVRFLRVSLRVHERAPMRALYDGMPQRADAPISADERALLESLAEAIKGR